MATSDALFEFFGATYILIGVVMTVILIALQYRISPTVLRRLKAIGVGFLIAGLFLLICVWRLF